jgi:threonyl-tRNA synthetase
MEKDKHLAQMRHSLAHVMAAAISRIYGYENVKFGVGPAIADGFYYDFVSEKEKIGEKDFAKIEKEMRKIIREKQTFVASQKPIADAEKWAHENHQDFKLELLKNLAENGTTVENEIENGADGSADFANFMTNGDYTDLCRGGHLANTGDIPEDSWKLDRMAGAYWRGDEKNPMMSRIYGVAFETKAELKEFFAKREEAKLRDHRKLGKDLDLFVFSELVGPGLPLFTPRGTVIREELAKYSNEMRERIGFQKVFSSHITKLDLYEKSGHLAKFGEGFAVEGQISRDKFMMKPMNCPHHTRIFASQHRSYRDMPVRYLETTTDYRDEKTGELGGLNRVRALTQDDSHLFVRPDQIDAEVKNLMDAVNVMYRTFGLKLRVRLSYRDDSDAYLGSRELWNSAQAQLKNAVVASGLEYFEQEGEAAFYGPKIDFMATDALGREHQLSTVQLDFVQPERFELEYSDENGNPARPVMIHCALLGSIERFMSVYIEHTAGKFPVWVAPEQVRIIQVNDSDSVVNFVKEIREIAFDLGVRVFVDDTNNSVGKKIRNSSLYKVPYAIVIGDKEAENREVVPRIAEFWRANDVENSYAIDGFLRSVANEAKTRASKSTL